jgi:SAM-dependent methyltransferase
MLISDGYRELNRQLHADNPRYGNDNFGWSKYVRDLVKGNGYASVLDYGCGKGRVAAELAELKISVAEYDPAIEGKDAPPEPADLVVCTDVLEHIEPVHLNAVLRHLREMTRRRLFVTIFTGPAGKTLADGRNAHLIQKPGMWWRAKLLEHFQVLLWEERGAVVAAELVAKKHTGRVRPAKRRTMTPQMLDFIGNIQTQINAASDAFSQISTTRMWEGTDDEPADLQGACDVIEHMDDIDEALSLLARNSLKCAFCAVKLSDLHSEWDWRRIIEKRFRVANWQIDQGHLLMVGAPTIMVQGVCAVGAVEDGERWKNVEAATKRVSKRIELADVHERTAIIACYGPSLIDTIEALKAEAADPNVDVISVSGAHDFLISHGVVPRYHIECDPRPHKALNIEKSHPDVTYMVASVCHPDYFDRLGEADIRLWHVSTAEHVLRLINELGESPKHVISGGGSVGLRSMPLLYAMGYRNMHIFAMDCSFKSDGETVRQWAGKHAGKKQDCCEVLCDQEIFISSPVLLTYATNFFETIQKVTDLNIRLYGHGLLQAMARFYMSQGALERVEPAGEGKSSNAAERAA